MGKIRLGLIGLSQRGFGLLKAVIVPEENRRDNVEVVMVCDLYEDRATEAADYLEKIGEKRPIVTLNHHDVITSPDVDAVIIMTSWESHIPLAIESMENGKYTAMEVGGAYSVEDCFKLVDAYERTGIHCMMLENCCYGRNELMVLNMVRNGLFGDIVHCSGGYLHDLRSEIAHGVEKRHYRLRNYKNRNCENYPTHELGPIAKVLDINRGNRMVSLVSVASCAKGLHEYIDKTEEVDKNLLNVEFAQGDIVTTIIKCAHGQTITLTLDTTLPRYYCRGFTVRGTKGMYEEANGTVLLDPEHDEMNWKEHWGCAENYREEWEHPIWKNFLNDGVRGGHGGMDWLVFSAFFESIERGIAPPIDTYDTAAWMSITPLSEQSIAMGGAPVAIPDFTRGAWCDRKFEASWEYDV